MRYAPNDKRTQGAEGRPAMKNRSTEGKRTRCAAGKPKSCKLTVGLDLGDKTSRYCILDKRTQGAEGRPAMKNRSTEGKRTRCAAGKPKSCKLTVGLDLGDKTSRYCILD